MWVAQVASSPPWPHILAQNGAQSRKRAAVILPGLGNNTSDYDKLASDLRGRGFPVSVAKVSRFDWLRNAAGLLDGNYWRGTLKPRPVLDWYLERMKAAINEVNEEDGVKVSLIGHSAGGWLARVYMLEFGHDDVSLLLTLGTPHLPPPKGVPGIFDQTRGLLNYVEENTPGAFHAPHVKYVCVASRYIKGATLDNTKKVATTGVGTLATTNTVVETMLEEDLQTENIPDSIDDTPVTYQARFVGQGYKQVCGSGDVWGDGVVPEISSHLNGAINMTLDGVYHSPVGANDDKRPWYGSPKALQEWVHYLD